VVTGSAMDPGAVDDAPLLIDCPAQDVNGLIATTTLGSGGTGYATTNTFNLDGAGDTNAQGVVDTVDGGGAVLTYHLTAIGTCYPVQNGITTTATSGGGSGLTINVTALTPQGDGESWVTVDYRVIPLH